MSSISAVQLRQTEAKLERIPFGSPAEDLARILDRDGGLILTGVLTRDQVAAVNAELDAKMGALPQGNFSDGAQNYLGDFMGHRTKRLTHCVKYSKTLREAFLNSPMLAEYLAATMPGPVGAHSLFSSHAIEIYPGEAAQTLHRDGGGLLESLGMNGPGALNPLTNGLLALTDVTEDMGATRVIPGSHLWDDFEVPGRQEQTVPATMDAGDVLYINSRVLHGGGANVTRDKPRRVLSSGFSLAYIMGEEAWPFVISVDEARTYPKQVQRLLGFRSISYHGEEPGFLWRIDTRPLEEKFGLEEP